jgi:spore germination protein KC
MLKGSWIKQASALLTLVLLGVNLTGCWDRLDIEERAVILGIGIDKAEPGKAEEEGQITHLKDYPRTKNGMVHITAQIAVPGRIPLGPSEGGGGGGGGQQTVWLADATGHTVEEAVNNLQQRVAPPLLFGHLRIIVVSQEVAEEGIGDINDYFRRNPEVRRMNWLLVSKGKAVDLLKASPQLERVPTLYFVTLMEQAVKMGRFPNHFLGIFWSILSSKGREGSLPFIELKGKDTVQINGLAYFRGDRMVGTTSPIEIPLYMGIIGEGNAGGRAFVKVPGTNNGYIVFGATSRRSNMKVGIKNGSPYANVKIAIEGNILEKSGDAFDLDKETLFQIEEQLEKDVRESYMKLISETQERSSDIFGFGEYVRGKESKYWNRNIETKERWREIYRDLPIEVSVQIRIRRIGMEAK